MPVSNSAFKIDLRRYDMAPVLDDVKARVMSTQPVTAAYGAAGRGLHSFSLELNLSNSGTHS
jgi:hypothetical protein